MKFQAISAAALPLAVYAQTPPNTQPATSGNLVVNYDNTTVTPGALLDRSLVAEQPLVSSATQLDGCIYMVALVDLSISGSNFNGTSAPLAPGLEPCRTTRLHWLQGNLTQGKDGAFYSTSNATAEYGGPMPPLHDIPHTYAFYLFTQPDDFELPAYDDGRNYTAPAAMSRMNFSAQALAEVAGAPLLANYIRVQYPNNTAVGSYPNGTCPSNLSGGLGNGTATGSSPAASYTGGVAKLGGAISAVMAVAGTIAFALL